MIIEHTTFRLAAGSSEADFLAADRAAQEAAMLQRGFVRRTTARGADGRWLVETFWYSVPDAVAAAADVGLAADRFAASVDPGSVEVVRWETLD